MKAFAAAFTAISVYAALAFGPPVSAAHGPAYSLVMIYHGEAFVIDHDLSADDCADLRPMDQWAKALSFTCEREA